jgi:hypothetical protein
MPLGNTLIGMKKYKKDEDYHVYLRTVAALLRRITRNHKKLSEFLQNFKKGGSLSLSYHKPLTSKVPLLAMSLHQRQTGIFSVFILALMKHLY